MRRILCAALVTLMTLVSAQMALADDTTNNLAPAAALSDSDIIPDCQGCSGVTPLVGASGTQLTTYLRTKFSASAPISYNSGTGAITFTGPLSVTLGGTGVASGTSGGILAFTGTTSLASSGVLSANALVLGGGVGTTPATLASLGTGTTLLHGNAAGPPTFGAVTLTTDVAGVLPVANGGTALASGTSGGILGYTGTGTLASSAVLPANALVLGGGAGATPSAMASLGTTTTLLHGNAAGAPSFGAVALTTDVSGLLPGGSGGTGLSTIAAHQVPLATATNIYTAKTVPDCSDVAGNHLNFTQSTDTFSCGTTGVGQATIIWTGTTGGTANAQTLTANGFTLADQNVIRAKIGVGLTTTGAATLNVNATGATAIKIQNNTGTPIALTGGELVAGNEYDLVYNSAAAAFVVTTPLPSGTTIGASSTTVTAAQWSSHHTFVITTANQTITLPAATGLSTIGGVTIQTIGVTATLAPNAADGINGGAINTPVIIPADTTVPVSSAGASGTTAIKAPLGPIAAISLTYAPGVNPNNLPIANASRSRTIIGIRCTPEIAAGGAATISVVKAASGVAISAGTVLHSGSCNANGTPAGDQNLTVTTSTLAPGDRLGLQTTGGTVWTTTGGVAAGVVTVFVQ
jgi:hypothetical protein